jgi:hypothetical protein
MLDFYINKNFLSYSYILQMRKMIVNPYIYPHDIAYYLYQNLKLLTETTGTITHLIEFHFVRQPRYFRD